MATVRHLGYFPFCLPLSNPVDTEPNFGYANLASAIAFFWRVKKFKWSATLSDGVSNSALCSSTFTRIADSEKNLVCFDQYSNNGLADYYTVDNTIDGPYDYDGFMAINSRFVWIKKEGNSTEQQVKVYFSIGFEGSSAALRHGWRVVVAEPEIGEASAELVEYKFGKKLLNLWTNTGEEFAEPTFEVLEYWPYDPEDGLGPIYDSTTGAQLRPFPG